MRNYYLTIALTLFLGGFGLHKFYLGKPVQGLLYLFFCWTWIPAIISFFEVLILLFDGKIGFDVRYNNGHTS